MSEEISELGTFIEVARNNRKYSKSYAAALKSALKIFEVELNDEERESVDMMKDNLDNIFKEVVSKNKGKIAISSLNTYRRRVSGLFNDYEKYGKDPLKMDQWRPRRRRVQLSEKPSFSPSTSPSLSRAHETAYATVGEIHNIEIALREGVTAKVIVPRDVTKGEVERIKAFLDATVVVKENIGE